MKNEKNNKLDENDLENEAKDKMARKKRFKSDNQRKAVMAKIKKGEWISKSYGKGSSATFYIPDIELPQFKIPDIEPPKYPLYRVKKKKKSTNR